MKIAICFWGLCRSTNFIIQSFHTQILQRLKSFNIEYDIYVHTYTLNSMYNNTRSKEKHMKLNNDLWKLLKPNYYILENQDRIDICLELEKYRTHGCPWMSPNFENLNNLIRALYSLDKVTELLEKSNKTYDFVMFCRPDVLFMTPITLKYFQIPKNTIILPNFGKYPINDRFCICSMDVAKIYGHRYSEAYEYSINNKLHSETYLDYILKKNNIIIQEIDFLFYRVRANGYVEKTN